MRVTVLGQGSTGPRHSDILRDLGCQVMTYDPLLAGANAPDEAAVLDGADAAVVASPSGEHERQALAAVAAGIPVLVEPPLALDAAGAAQVRRASERADVAVEVAMNLRYHPGILGVRAALNDAGGIVRASAWSGSRLPGRPRDDSGSASRGALLDAIHEIDYLLWLLGPARRSTRTAAHGLDTEEGVCLHVEHRSGALSSIALETMNRPPRRGCRLFGKQRTIDWDWSRGSVRVHGPHGLLTERLVPADEGPTYVAQMERFLAVARGEQPPFVGAVGGHAALEVVDAARADELALRPAGPVDRDRLLAWRNEPAVRAASRAPEEIPEAEHAAWFAGRMTDPGTQIFVVEYRGAPAGTVRVERLDGDRGEIHVALAPEARGRGLAALALREATERGTRELAVATIEANVREDNVPSMRAFARAGFTEVGRDGGWVQFERAPACDAGVISPADD